jgi:hypothetical protein
VSLVFVKCDKSGGKFYKVKTNQSIGKLLVVNPQVAGGTEVSNITEVPYHVGIANGGLFANTLCSGALIDDDWVVTAASCFTETYDLINIYLCFLKRNKEGPKNIILTHGLSFLDNYHFN